MRLVYSCVGLVSLQKVIGEMWLLMMFMMQTIIERQKIIPLLVNAGRLNLRISW